MLPVTMSHMNPTRRGPDLVIGSRLTYNSKIKKSEKSDRLFVFSKPKIESK